MLDSVIQMNVCKVHEYVSEKNREPNQSELPDNIHNF